MPPVSTIGTTPKVTLRHVTTVEKKGKSEPLLKVLLTREKLLNPGENSVISKIRASVPRIRSNGGTGSGFVISPDGFILTAAHVVKYDDQRLLADFPMIVDRYVPYTDQTIYNKPRGEGYANFVSSPVKVIAANTHEDIALLALCEREDPWNFIEIANNPPKKGDIVYSIGHPGRYNSFTLTSGEIIYAERGIISRFIDNLVNSVSSGEIKSTNPTSPGDSGGVLCDENGNAYGIVIGGSLGISYVFSLGMIKKNPYYSNSTSMHEQVFPFFRELGINPDDVLAGKPLKSASDKVYRAYKKAAE